MATKPPPRTFTPGPVTPNKYPVGVGPNYMQYGEQTQNGYIYVPQYDQYYLDTKQLENYYQESGLTEKPPEPPGLMESLLPVAGTVGAIYGAKELAPQLVGSISEGTGVMGGLGGLFGGPTEAAAATEGTLGSVGGVSGIGPLASGAEYGAALGQGVSGIGPVASGSEYAAALGAGEGGMLSLGGIGAGGNLILPAAGALGAYDLFANDRGGGRGVLQGAASGAMIGSYFNPVTGGLPIGTLAGAGIGGLVGLANNFFGGDKERFKDEWKKWQKLEEQGISSPIPLQEPLRGRSKEELLNPNYDRNFQGFNEQGQWINNKFSQSRDEKDLRAPDVRYFAAPYEKFGQEYASASDETKDKVNEALLAAGAYQEHHGTMDLKLNSDLEQRVRDILAGKTTAPTPAPGAPIPMPRPTSQADAATGTGTQGLVALGAPQTPAPVTPGYSGGNQILSGPQASSGASIDPGRFPGMAPAPIPVPRAPTSNGLLALNARPAGFDEDPNRPGHFIRRAY